MGDGIKSRYNISRKVSWRTLLAEAAHDKFSRVSLLFREERGYTCVGAPWSIGERPTRRGIKRDETRWDERHDSRESDEHGTHCESVGRLREGEKPKSDAWDKRLILRSSLRVIPTPNPIPVRHPRARMRISRLITFASHGTAVRVNKSQQRGLFIDAKYKIEGTVYRGKYATFYIRLFVGIIFDEYSIFLSKCW